MLEILNKLLSDGTISQAVIDALSPKIEEFENNSKAVSAELKTVKTQLSNFQSTNESLKTQITLHDEAIAKAKESGKTEVVAELQDAQKSLQELQTTLEKTSQENLSFKTNEALNRGLKNYDVNDSDVVSFYLKNQVEFKDDVLMFKDGENVLTLDDGLKKFFEGKPNLLKAQGGSGSGAGGSGHSGGNSEDFQP